MKKITPLTLAFLCCVFLSKKSTCQKFDFQLRYSHELHGPYFRGNVEIPLSKKITLCGGVSKDAIEMIDITNKYQLFKTIQIEIGVGYHKQNNVHLIYGLSAEFQTKKIHFTGYARGYLDHKSLYSSEAEIFYKTKPKARSWLGCIWDIEYGKYFEPWREVTQTTPLQTEGLLLGGLTWKYHASEQIHINLFYMVGSQTINHETHPTYKAGIALNINLNREKHHH